MLSRAAWVLANKAEMLPILALAQTAATTWAQAHQVDELFTLALTQATAPAASSILAIAVAVAIVLHVVSLVAPLGETTSWQNLVQ